MNKEIWKVINGFDGKYFISTLGNVKNSDGLILKQRFDKYGYKRISLTNNIQNKKIVKTFFIHRLIAEHFLENKLNYPHVAFKNKCKEDVTLENLEWCKKAGNPNRTCKNKGKEIINLDTNEKYANIAEASRIHGISMGALYNCCNKKTKTANGIRWRYLDENIC